MRTASRPGTLPCVTSPPHRGRDIEARRHRLNWSQNRLAAAARVAEKSVQNAEHGHVSDRTYTAIVRALEDGERAATHPGPTPEVVELRTQLLSKTGPVTVVVTGPRDALRRVDLGSLVRDILTDA